LFDQSGVSGVVLQMKLFAALAALILGDGGNKCLLDSFYVRTGATTDVFQRRDVVISRRG